MAAACACSPLITAAGWASPRAGRSRSSRHCRTVPLSLVDTGRVRDRVGISDTVRTGGAPRDASSLPTLSASGVRTVTALQLSNGLGGVWDTTSPNAAWLLGVALSLDAALLN